MKASRVTAWALAIGVALSRTLPTRRPAPEGDVHGEVRLERRGQDLRDGEEPLFWVGDFTGTLFNDKPGGFMDRAAAWSRPRDERHPPRRTDQRLTG